MDKKEKFSVCLTGYICDLISLLTMVDGISSEEAAEMIYNSNTYKEMEVYE